MSENKHTASDLAQMQSLPLEAKIRMTKYRIKEWYEHWDGQVYVSFSGGKDSTVMKHLVDSMYSDVPSVFVNTGLEYPEIQKFVRDVKAGKYDCFNTDVEMLRPEMRFDEVIKKYGYPFPSKEVSQSIYEAKVQGKINNIDVRETSIWNRKFNPESDYSKKYPSFCIQRWDWLFDAPFDVSHMCCKIMKKNPVKKYEKETGRKAFIGLMADESAFRKQQWMKTGCNAFDKKRPQSQPMAFWTEQDVLEYIVKYEVPYCPVYGMIQAEGELEGQMYIDGFHQKLCTSGMQRTGCMFCMFGCQLDKLGIDKDKNRFQLMKETHPKQYAYCMKPVSEGGLGIKEVLEYIGVPYE